ncbi:hypothetical protein [Motilimonas sp. KMU-193]|uniref:hypothetical protein n=1 Tax=Motilimonas sp. KMU-193 TaxID=3388668 RepID=UPI00396B4410
MQFNAKENMTFGQAIGKPLNDSDYHLRLGAYYKYIGFPISLTNPIYFMKKRVQLWLLKNPKLALVIGTFYGVLIACGLFSVMMATVGLMLAFILQLS